MTLHRQYMAKLKANQTGTAPTPKVGTEIFGGGDYPQGWDGLIGQSLVKEQMQAAIRSCLGSDRRLPHTLLASGVAGVGKSTVAQIIGFQLGVRFLPVSGPMTALEFRRAVSGLSDDDVLCWDEIHTAVTGNRNRADWLLPYMTDHVLLTGKGRWEGPDVTIVGATTEPGKLPLTLLSRFMLKPTFAPYGVDEGVELATALAVRMGVALLPEDRVKVALASDCNPRAMREILTNLDFATSVEQAIGWAGYSPDGLSKIAQDILLVLLGADGNRASAPTIASMLGEPGSLQHHEQQLLQRGLMVISGTGRTLTESGLDRAKELTNAETR